MSYDDPAWTALLGCLKSKDPGIRERADAWVTAIGLQDVDHLRVSSFLLGVALRNVRGEITQKQARKLIDAHYADKKTGTRVEKTPSYGRARTPAAPKSGQKKRSEKSGQKTVDRLWQLLKEHPHLSQAGLVAALDVTRSTIQKHIANLKAAGRLRRIGPDKGGHWEVVGAGVSHAERAEHAERSLR